MPLGEVNVMGQHRAMFASTKNRRNEMNTLLTYTHARTLIYDVTVAPRKCAAVQMTCDAHCF